jgi:hypothetical protein
MTQLAPVDFKKDGKSARGGPYKGKQYVEIAEIKIKENRPFIMGLGPDGTKVYGKVLNNENGTTLSYCLIPGSKITNGTIKISSFLKDEDFGGMSGSRVNQAKNTGPTESGCAYYCSLAFNIIKGKLVKGDDSKTNLEAAAKFVEATSSLTEFLKEGPENWHEENVYVNTANEVYAKFGRKFKGHVYCHRGSKFMNDLYKAFASAKTLDAKEDKLAPGSFNNNKWNPGDIWLSSFDPNSQPLKECKNFTELKKCVLRFAGADSNGKSETELLAVSLKKPGNPKKAILKEFNTETRTNFRDGEVTYDGFSYGKTGDFFSSNDIYIYVGGKSVQFRAFNTSKSWQGNIIGTGALGGKIGGGNIDYYLEQSKIGTLGPNSGFHEILDSQLRPKDYKLLFLLYKKYWGKQSKVNNKKFPIILDEATFEAMRKGKEKHFTWQKLMSMRMIDLIQSASKAKANFFATELVRYAASNTQISTYFIKVE